jgi:hypothetical protein
MVKTAGRNSYTYQCKWTGTRWISAWQEDEPTTEEVKIKEWQGLAQDPDADLTAMDVDVAFNEFNFEQTITEIEKAVEELENQVNGKTNG